MRSRPRARVKLPALSDMSKDGLLLVGGRVYVEM